MGALDLDGVRRHAAAAGRATRRRSGASRPGTVRPGPGPRPSGAGSHPAGPSRRRPRAAGARRGRILGRAVAALAAVLTVAVTAVLVWGFRLTTDPHPDEPAHVDALLVLYTDPAVYDAALELAGEGVTDRLFVSGYLHPDGFEKLCGAPADADPRLDGVTVECFSPDPVTTQGEVVFASERMEALGLHSLGVLTHGRHLERSRILAERCWSGPGESVAMYQYHRHERLRTKVQQTLYGTLAFLKVAATPGCDQHSDWLQRPVDRLKQAGASSPAVGSVDPADWAAQASVPGAATRKD